MNIKPTRKKVITSLLVAVLTEIVLAVAVLLTVRPNCDPNDKTTIGITGCGYGFDATDVLLRASLGGLYYALMVFLAVYLVYALFEKK